MAGTVLGLGSISGTNRTAPALTEFCGGDDYMKKSEITNYGQRPQG